MLDISKMMLVLAQEQEVSFLSLVRCSVDYRYRRCLDPFISPKKVTLIPAHASECPLHGC